MDKFIKKCVSILPKSLQDIYYKYEEQLLYLFFGGLTTVVSIITKLIGFQVFPDNQQWWRNTVVLAFSWICAVTFAFFTNKKYVFKNETNSKKDFWKVFASFYGSRVTTYLLEMLIFYICCDLMHISEVIITFASQIIILVANYLLSKIFVFKNKEKVQ